MSGRSSYGDRHWHQTDFWFPLPREGQAKAPRETGQGEGGYRVERKLSFTRVNFTGGASSRRRSAHAQMRQTQQKEQGLREEHSLLLLLLFVNNNASFCERASVCNGRWRYSKINWAAIDCSKSRRYFSTLYGQALVGHFRCLTAVLCSFTVSRSGAISADATRPARSTWNLRSACRNRNIAVKTKPQLATADVKELPWSFCASSVVKFWDALKRSEPALISPRPYVSLACCSYRLYGDIIIILLS